MDAYESMIEELQSVNIPVIESETILKYGIDGLWKNTDGEDYIFINPKLDHNKKFEVLNEEYGHYLTSTGIHMNYDDPATAKYEHRARMIAGGHIISLDDITDVLSGDSMTLDEIAVQVDVEPELLVDTFDYFRKFISKIISHNGFVFDLRDGVKITREYSWV